jgi:hypothetical protein
VHCYQNWSQFWRGGNAAQMQDGQAPSPNGDTPPALRAQPA